MRSSFVAPGAGIHYFTVEWEPSALSFVKFRSHVIGATDSSKAEPGSLRRTIYDQWEGLGLRAQGESNGVHGSAGPFEALAERINWLEANGEKDPYMLGLAAGSLNVALVKKWCKEDPLVTPRRGQRASVFDLLEGLDAEPCKLKARSLAADPVRKYEAAKSKYMQAVDMVEDTINRMTAAPAVVKAGAVEMKVTCYNNIAGIDKTLLRLIGKHEEDRVKYLAREMLTYSRNAASVINSLSVERPKDRLIIRELEKRGTGKVKFFCTWQIKALMIMGNSFLDYQKDPEEAVKVLKMAKKVYDEHAADFSPAEKKVMERTLAELQNLVSSGGRKEPYRAVPPTHHGASPTPLDPIHDSARRRRRSTSLEARKSRDAGRRPWRRSRRNRRSSRRRRGPASPSRWPPSRWPSKCHRLSRWAWIR